MSVIVYCDHSGRGNRYTFPKVTADGEASPEIMQWRLDGGPVEAGTPGAQRWYTFACPVCRSSYRWSEERLLPALARIGEGGRYQVSVQNLQRAISQARS